MGRAPSAPSSRTHWGQAEGPDSPPLPLMGVSLFLRLAYSADGEAMPAPRVRTEDWGDILHVCIALWVCSLGQCPPTEGIEVRSFCTVSGHLSCLIFHSHLSPTHIPGTLPPSCFRSCPSLECPLLPCRLSMCCPRWKSPSQGQSLQGPFSVDST